jgi:hypothetical protein
MIGCTLITPSYAEIGLEAVKRFKQHTGLDVVILWREDGPDAFAAKLDIPLTIRDQKVVFFDSDLWFIHHTDLTKFDEFGSFYAVADPGVNDIKDESINVAGAWARKDCETLGIEPSLYFNGGLWIADFRYAGTRLAFAIARQLYEDKKNCILKIGDYGEQSMLNAGIQRAGVKINLMPMAYNYWHMAYKGGLVSSVPYRVIGLHAAGYSLNEKANHLRVMSEVLGVWFDQPRPNAFTP